MTRVDPFKEQGCFPFRYAGAARAVRKFQPKGNHRDEFRKERSRKYFLVRNTKADYCF